MNKSFKKPCFDFRRAIYRGVKLGLTLLAWAYSWPLSILLAIVIFKPIVVSNMVILSAMIVWGIILYVGISLLFHWILKKYGCSISKN